LIALLLLTAVAYLWDLSASGYANSFYAAAVQAGTKSWKAMFFGSIDSSNFITVDKPPASLWVMELSGRIFGFSSWSMLVPQALEGVAAVGLLYAAVKRWFGSGAGLAAGAMFALTPVAALMFRFNNPDALLVLTLVASAYCLTRALERAGTRWILATGVMIGVAFLAKMGQAFLVLPAYALVYMVAAPTGVRRRPAAARRPSRHRERRLVGRDRCALAGELAALHRRLARQQHPQPDHRLQRARADLRQRRPGRRRWRRSELQRRDRPPAPVR
jgi:4-amino-4-deoxy-L-arabinose transferase-like glycosyltransferase